MARKKRAFIFGAGFSKPAGMPMATELIPLLEDRLDLDEMRKWLRGVRERLEWLSGRDPRTGGLRLNIEEVFHYAHFDIEVHRLRQHLEPVGRYDGPGTAWNLADSISAWLTYLERDLCDVIWEAERRADLSPITRWAATIADGDSVLTFNYDTLVERALSDVAKAWNHGFAGMIDGIGVFKLHGSIDWLVAHRQAQFSKLDLLFDKANSNRLDRTTGHIEDDCRLWRCRTKEQLHDWLAGRDGQSTPEQTSPTTVGIAGLGAYKQLHQIPGLGRVWTEAMRALHEADQVVVVGFSMSNFDAMAQLQFGDVVRRRQLERRSLNVTVVDPFADEAVRDRFTRVFRAVRFINCPHETIDWALN